MSNPKDDKELLNWAKFRASECRRKENMHRIQAEIYEEVSMEISIMMDEIEKRIKP